MTTYCVLVNGTFSYYKEVDAESKREAEQLVNAAVCVDAQNLDIEFTDVETWEYNPDKDYREGE